MMTTNNSCPCCGFRLVQVGHDTALPFCPNQYCADKYDDVCPRCQSAHKQVRLAGTGSAAFSCLDCGQDWDRLSRRATAPSSSNLIVLNFRKPRA
jgi:transposase-like protein